MTFERPEIIEEEKSPAETRAERLKDALSEVVYDLRAAGFPIGDDGRVDMDAFKNIRGDSVVENHKNKVDRAEGIFDLRKRNYESEEGPIYRKLSDIEEGREKTDGDQLEALKTIMFHKFMGSKFFTMRTSRYDDLNGIDNLIIEKDTGNVVGALDEVVDIEHGARLETKEDKILDKNKSGGGFIRYGFELERDGSKLTPKPAENTQTNIPVFHLALSKKDLYKAIDILKSDDDISEHGKVFFNLFLDSMNSQIAQLEKMSYRLDVDLMDRVDSFSSALKALNQENNVNVIEN